MRQVTIHQSGEGGDKFEVVSYGNGLAYEFQFGEAGCPMRTLFFQGDDATLLRNEFDLAENTFPDEPTRELWLRVLDPFL